MKTGVHEKEGININTFYTAFSVLKDYIETKGFTLANFTLRECSASRATMWVQDNAENVSHFVCHKVSCTQFEIWGFNGNGEQIVYTGFDYADVNTPKLERQEES